MMKFKMIFAAALAAAVLSTGAQAKTQWPMTISTRIFQWPWGYNNHGATLQFTIKNPGPDDVSPMAAHLIYFRVTDVLPAGARLVSYAGTNLSNWSCTPVATGVTTVICNSQTTANFLPGQTMPVIDITVKMPASAHQVTNCFQLEETEDGDSMFPPPASACAGPTPIH